MSIAVDILLAAIFLITIIVYAKNGFLASLVKLFRTIIAIILSLIFGPKLSAFLYQYVFYKPISNGIYQKLRGFFDQAAESFDLSYLFDKIPPEIFKFLGMSSFEEKYRNMTDATEETFREMSDSFSSFVTRAVSNVTAYVALFLLVFLILTILILILKGLRKVPLFKTVDTVFGLVLGVTCGTFHVFLLACILHAVLVFICTRNISTNAMTIYDSSYLFKFVYLVASKLPVFRIFV